MLARCLRSLAEQTQLPDEVIVVWQGDDTATRDLLATFTDLGAHRLKVLHLAQPGIVPAENMALGAATGEIVFLIDDDAVAPKDWIARHLALYADPKVGAVGGPADNFYGDGTPFPKRAVDPIGILRWFGRYEGNMYDHPEEWKSRSPRDVDHLVGYNLSFRRNALERFDERLRPYWQQFEMDACLQIKRRGFRVLFDFANRVEHHPTNPAYNRSRDSHLDLRNYNPAYNEAYVLSKHSRGYQRPIRLSYLLGIGTLSTPGLVAFAVATARFRKPVRETTIFLRCLMAKVQGWQAGSAARRVAQQTGE
jgi:GT2 family glycosyltransferase